MIASDVVIKSLMREGQIRISPEPEKIGVASVDLHLGPEIFVYSDDLYYIDITKPPDGMKIDLSSYNGAYLIPPHKFILAHTKETISLGEYIAALVTGVSSIGRLGLFVENAGFIDPGFTGQITLELYNANDRSLLIKEGMRICQLLFFKLAGPPSKTYAGKYIGQLGPTPSRMYKEFGDEA